MSEGEAAAMLDISAEEYVKAERDKALLDDSPECNEPTIRDLCLIARRRAAVPLAVLCKEAGGISKPTFYRLERSGHPDIVDIWRRRGFIFPTEF